MKIKLAIIEKDKNYLNRIISVFNTKYSDKFEIYSFTEIEVAFETLEHSKVDIVLVDEQYEIDFDKISKRCGFAYLTDSMGADSINNQRAICKFQRVDLIYKQILSIYSENAGNISGLGISDDTCRVVAFTSPCGGTGSSTMAASYAVYCAKKGKKVLYLNLEKFGSSDLFFSAEGQFDMSDVIFALKSKKTNLSIKLESCVKQDVTGVYFYSQTKNSLDMLELQLEEKTRLVSEIKLSGIYDVVIVDTDFGFDIDNLKFLKLAENIVWTGDGSEISNMKINRAYSALMLKEENEEEPLSSRIVLIYNKFSNKSGRAVSGVDITNIGGAPRYEHASTKQVVEQLCNINMFEKLD